MIVWLAWFAPALAADCVFDADSVWKGIVDTVKRAPDARDVRTGDHRLDLRMPDGSAVTLAVQGCIHLEIQAIVVVPDPWNELPATPVGPWLARAAAAARFAPGHLHEDLLRSWVDSPPVPTTKAGSTVYVGGDETWPHTVSITRTPGATVVRVVRAYD